MRIDWSKYDLSKAVEIADRFGQKALTEMHKQIQDMSLVDKGNLLKSLKFKTKVTQQTVDFIGFKYEFYGKFLQVGVNNAFGKDVNLAAKTWRSNAFEATVPELSQEFSDFYGELILSEITPIDSVNLRM